MTKGMDFEVQKINNQVYWWMKGTLCVGFRQVRSESGNTIPLYRAVSFRIKVVNVKKYPPKLFRLRK